MQRSLRTVFFILFSFLWLASCSDMAMFAPSVSKSVGIDVLSLSEGDFIDGEVPIDFIIQTEERSAEPELLEITLFTSSEQGIEQSVWSTSVSSPLTDEALELLLPDLENGHYTIVFSVLDEEGGREEERISFFYITGDYAIRGINSYPPTTMVGHETVLEADLQYPAQANPYVRWSQEGTVLAKGSVAEGYQKITWPAPEEAGVYTIRVEMFPVPPPLGGDFSFSSSVELTAKLFVSAASLLTEDELVPEDSYYSLFHLNGTLGNSGLLGNETTEEEAKPIGQARWSTENGIMGLETGSGLGFLYPLNILPIVDGELSPCTITFKVLPSGENAGQNLLRIDGNDEFRLRIFFDADAQLVAEVGIRDMLLYLPSEIFGLEPDRHRRIDLSLIPREERFQALWFLDGRQTASIDETPLPRDLPRRGQTFVAGANGFRGIITELGIYYRDPLNRPSVDPGIYRMAMERQYGRRLVLAEGFEGMHLPDPESWMVRSTETVTLDRGRLLLPQASRLTLPFFELGEKETSFLVEFFGTIPTGSTVALLWEGEEDPFFTVDPTGYTSRGGEPERSEEFSPAEGSLRLILSAGQVILATADDPIRYEFDPPVGRSSWLSVTLGSPNEGDDLEIDTILITEDTIPTP
jgi:hypothetical protein